MTTTHTTHAVPRNMGRVERLWKGLPDRFIYVALGCVIAVAYIMIQFFYATSWQEKLFNALLFFIVVIGWMVLARSPRMLDRSLLFGLFYVRGAAGYNLLTKYSLTDDRLNALLNIVRFHPEGTVEFKNGYGWIFAFDCDSVNRDSLDGFNSKSQALLNSLTEEIFFKIEVRIEPKQDAQLLTEKTNTLINAEKNPGKLAHLKSIYEYSKEKETHDYERRYYFFIGIAGKRTVQEAVIMKEKIEQGFKDKVNNLNIVFSQIKNQYLLFDFYAGELR